MAIEQPGALSGYRILDLADSKGAYCGKLLADLGAEVIKIENPRGDETRNIPPFAGGTPHPEGSLYFLYRNANKYGITLNLETPDGKAIFKRLVNSADALVETYQPGYMKSLGLGYEALKEVNPGLIMASITEFGQDGPYRDWKGSAIVDFALSTSLIASGHSQVPCNMPTAPCYDGASLMAAISIVVSLYHRGSTAVGHYIDVSVHQAARYVIYPTEPTLYSYDINPGAPPPAPRVRNALMTFPIYPCKDGWIRVVALTPWQWDGLVKALGDPEVLRLPEWRDWMHRIANADDLYAIMVEYSMNYTMEELFERGRQYGVPIAPVHDVAGFFHSPQTRARGFFVEMDHPTVGRFDYPGPPYKWTETPAEIRCPAPLLGQHNEKVYCQELGFSPDEVAALRQAGVI